MALAYKISDIVVSPSIEPEAFGRVAVEAQSMEKIIIASNIGGSNETILNEKTGLLFESGDAGSLSKKIIQKSNIICQIPIKQESYRGCSGTEVLQITEETCLIDREKGKRF